MTTTDATAIRAQMEALAGFSAGPWIYYADLPSVEPNWHIVTTSNKMRVLANVHIEPGNAMDVANASLIAAAPDMRETILALCDALDDLRAENERLRAELAWYGEQSRLARIIHSEGDSGRHALQADGGHRARAALAQKGGE